MTGLEQFNRELFLQLNAAADTAPFVITLTKLVANGLILYVPLLLALLWLGGDDKQRSTTLKAFVTMAGALCVNFIIGHIWHHPRPLEIQLGNTFFFHVLDASFPSDHTTGVASVGFALLGGGLRRPAYVTLLIAALIGWARVFLGVHFPFDIIGAFVFSFVAACAVSYLWKWVGPRLTDSVNKIYRTLLAPLIARGWLPK